MRYVMGYKSQQQWKKFKVSDLKFNTRCFKRWIEKEQAIFDKSEKYQKLPDTETVLSGGKRRVSTSSDIVISEESPAKRRFVVLDDSTDED